MPMPSGRPDNILNAIKIGFKGRMIWPKATANPEAHYQQLAITFGYIIETPAGLVMTDLGARESNIETILRGR